MPPRGIRLISPDLQDEDVVLPVSWNAPWLAAVRAVEDDEARAPPVAAAVVDLEKRQRAGSRGSWGPTLRHGSGHLSDRIAWAPVLVSVTVLAAGLLSTAVHTPAAASQHHDAEFLSRLNDMRAAHGVHHLEVHGGLVAMANRWAGAMAERDEISHNPSLTSEAPPNWTRLGENVGVGMTVEKIHNAFAASDTHRRNMLNPGFTYVGVGVVTGRDGAIFVTQNFMATAETAAPRSQRGAAEAPQHPAELPSHEPAGEAAPPAPPRVWFVIEILARLQRMAAPKQSSLRR